MNISKHYKKLKKYLKKRGNKGDVKMSNFGSIIIITLLATACAYYLVGGSIFTLADPPAGSAVVIPEMPKKGQSTNALQLTTFGGPSILPTKIPAGPQPTSPVIPTQPTDSTGGPASISAKVGCSTRGTVTFTFSLTDPNSPTYNISVTFPATDNIPVANLSLAAGEAKTVDTGKAALAGGAIFIDGLPDSNDPKNFPSRVCSVPSPTPTP